MILQLPMPARPCPQCGTSTPPAAKFCAECGVSLRGGPSAAPWRLTGTGAAAVGFFLLAGLGIWTAILSPSPPKPAPGGGAPARQAAAGPRDLPPDHPPVPAALPAEAKTFIDDLVAKTKAAPDDVASWLKLGQVSYRAAQIDPSYFPQAIEALQHVLGLESDNTEAMRVLANVYFDREEPKQAITYYERYLALKPDDAAARTALAAMYVSTGEKDRGTTILRSVLEKDASFWPAHYYLGVTLGQGGDGPTGLAELRKARDLAPDDSIRSQIDDAIASLGGTPPAPAAAAPAGGGGERTPFQRAVETAFRAHPIMGPKIAGFVWSGSAAGRVLLQNFPMDGMPPAVRDKFTSHLAELLRQAQADNAVDGAVKMEIADATSGTVMATVTP
jgi:cytochrome c-type biogenesis protein CcmH/NrfG